MAIIVDATKPAPPADYPPRALVPAEMIAAVDLDALQPYTADSLSLTPAGSHD
jgi:2,5-furandicarboxylate decarboxylase 1